MKNPTNFRKTVETGVDVIIEAIDYTWTEIYYDIIFCDRN